MKILLASTAVYLGNYTGANKINRLLVEQLAARGHECQVVAIKHALMTGPGDGAVTEAGAQTVAQTAESEIVTVGGVEVHIVDVANLGDLPKLRAYLHTRIQAFDPTWIFVSSEDWGQFVLEAAIQAAAERVIYLAHTGMALPFGPDSLMPNPQGTRLLAKAAAVVALSRYLSDYITEQSGIPATHLYAPAYGPGPFPDLSSFDRGYVTMVNPCAVKGLPIFLDLARTLPDVAFAAVPTWGTTDADLAAMEAEPNITLLAKTERIDEIFAQSRVFLVPSLWHEVFGLIVVEAMLRGIPVIASDVGGIPEAKLGTDYLLPVRPITKYVLDDSLSLAQDVPAQEIAPWAAALQALLSDPELYARQSAASQAAAQAFVERCSVTEYEDLLNRLFQQRAERVAAAAQSAVIEQRIDQLSAKKRALLELLRKEKASAQKSIPLVPRTSNTFPLSYAQQRVWVMEQLAPGSPLYLIPTALRLRGPLNQAALAAALSGLVERHEALRTTFAAPGGTPQQTIQAAQPVALPLHDLSVLPASEREAAVHAQLRAAAAQPFDLGRDVLLRAALLRCADDEHVLLVTLHHIAADGWSLDVLMRELGALYAAAAHAADVRLPALAIQYADYAVWQQQWLSADGPGTPRATQLTYWQQQLTAAPTVLELPSDRPRPAVPSYRGATEEWLLPPALTTALTGFCQREGVTKFMTLLAAWNALLYRYSGQTDLLIGTPVANRVRQETEGLIGFFANTLVLRTQVEGTLSGRELLGRVKQTALDAYAHQDVPFEMVLDAVQPERHASHTPLFQVAFAHQLASTQVHKLPDLELSPVSIESSTAKFDLTLAIVEEGEKLVASLEYSTDLFDTATVYQMLSHYERILSALVADVSQPIAQMPLLSVAERRQLLDEFTATARPYPADQPVQRIFEAQAARTPDAVAVVAGQTSLRYAELNREANQLAHWLRAQGVARETLVGVCLERSPRLIVALLAILKAGGAYLPLDASYPAERLQFMLNDGSVRVLLTETALADALPADIGTVLCLDQAEAVLSAQPAENLALDSAATDLAYIIYTSGSTGTPKGVMIPHHGITRLVFGVDYVQLDAAQSLLQMAPVSFDASTFEIWGALLHGGRCVMIEERVPTTADIGRVVQAHGISTMWLTASLFNSVIDEAPEALRGVRQLLIGGEALSVRHVARAQQALPETQIINGYGPTESTTFACCYPIPRLVEPYPASIPIGRPIGNTTVYVLDEALQPVPIGVPGELYIGGDGLARGYLNRPELTEEKFMYHPFSTSASARLYKTGDQARYRRDGTVEYLGRLDQQVKLRGFRIELGEIESVLRQHPALQDVVVLAREDAPGDKRLVAYIVPHGALPTIDSLRMFVQTRLPAYMVPSAFATIDALPLTPNGKLDRKALPAPDAARPDFELEFVAPRTPTEQELAAIWTELLGVPDIGVYDNFFALGGHSLLATQLMVRVRDAFGIELFLRDFFELPTIESLSTAIVQQLAGQQDDAQLADLLAQLEQLEQLPLSA